MQTQFVPYGRTRQAQRYPARRAVYRVETLEQRLLLSATAGKIFASLYASTIGEYTTTGTTVNAALVSGFTGGIAAAGSDIFVLNQIAGTVSEYSDSGATVNATLISGLISPVGLAISGSDIFVGNNNEVSEYDLTGAVVSTSLIQVSPEAIAVSGSDLFIAIYGGTIGEYTTDGATVNASLISGQSVNGIAVSGSDIFVTAGGGRGGSMGITGTVAEYTTSGTIVNATLISGLKDPQGIAVSGSNLFLLNFVGGNIGEYTTSGDIVNASLASTPAYPMGIAISGSTIFVTNPLIGTISAYTTTGATISAPLLTGLGSVDSIATDGSDLFVANSYAGTIGEYTTSGQTVNAALISGLTNPKAVAVSGSDIFVASGGASGVLGEYTTSGATVNASLASVGEFPNAIAVSGSDLFVQSIHAVGEYSTAGAVVNASLIPGLSEITGFTVSGTNVFVAYSHPGADTTTIGEYTLSGATINASLITGLSFVERLESAESALFIETDTALALYNTAGDLLNSSLVSGAGLWQSFAVVYPGPAQSPAFSNAASTAFSFGTFSRFTVSAPGYPPAALTISSGTLPAGITFVDNTDGTATLSGTPAAGTGGVYNLTLRAKNGTSNARQSFTLTSLNLPPTITSAPAASFTVTQPAKFVIQTIASPIAAITESGALPGGITFQDMGNGRAKLLGTPDAASEGIYTLTFTARNGMKPNAKESFTLTILPEPPGITSADSVTFTAGSPGRFVVRTSGSPIASIMESGALPPGVTLTDRGNGTAVVSGTPGAESAGSYPITIVVKNGTKPNGKQSFTLTVVASSGGATPAAVAFNINDGIILAAAGNDTLLRGAESVMPAL